jgi:pSer/pThr/pTyr-binding forkhead associated (FHA) protein
MAETKASPLEAGNLDESGKIPENAFLIVEGVKVFPLTTSVINIGRRLDNQLVIDDPRVSRNHAQLRSIKGRFVVFDLNSTGGTFVNGQRTSQSVLYPGDVIEYQRHRRPPDCRPERSNYRQIQEEMSGLIVLVLRILLAIALYGFLGWALIMLWRDTQRQSKMLATRRVPTISLSLHQENYAPSMRHFSQPEITLGRDPACDISITDDTVSTRHAQLNYHHGQWWLEDLASTNGTLLNNNPVTMPTVLTARDEIQCGKTTLIVNLSADILESPTQRLEKQ